MLLQEIIMILFAYTLGSISSAILVCRLYGFSDPREYGSGNPGATNVLRLGGYSAAMIVLFFDMLKGALPVWISYKLNMPIFVLGFVGIAACLGHIFPIFFHFRGGKGVATALGSIAPIGLDLTGIMLVVWLMVVMTTGYSSLAAICASLIAPLFTWLIKPQFTLPVAMLSCLIILCHHSNIKRLLTGEENKITNKKTKKT